MEDNFCGMVCAIALAIIIAVIVLAYF